MISTIADLDRFMEKSSKFKGKNNLYLKQNIRENRKMENAPKSSYEAGIKLIPKQNGMKNEVTVQSCNMDTKF